MSQPTKTAKDIFLMALDAEQVDRAALLDVECAEDIGLRRQVEQLLKVHDEPDSLLDSPRIDLGISGVAVPEISPTIDQPITEKPGTQIGPYKLLQQIGEGGMGVVYMAEQKQPMKRRVALKIIKPGMDTRQVIARFEAERQALALMDHPNIAKVLDAGQTESGRPYFVMELVNGISVTKYCDQQHLTPKERLQLFVNICQAVQHAHQKGIIHRDLKPSNVLVALYDGKAVPKVIDFGVAKATNQSLTDKTMFTQLGQIVGTLEYMSPEQAERNQLDVDTRSDIYSLGVILYELLSGETPFDSKKLRSAALEEMLRIIREDEPSKPSTKVSSSESLPSIAANRRIDPQKLGATIRGELDWIVMKALEKDRARRYETASKFAEDVEHYLNDEAVQACPPSAAYRFRKFARRNNRRLVAAAVLAIALLVAVGSIAGSIGWIASDRASRQSKLTDQVDLILDDVVRLENQQDWPAALAAAKRAETALASGEADAATLRRVRSVLDDLELVSRLEKARLYESLMVEAKTNTAGADLAYAQAFVDAGLTVESLTVEKAAAQLQRRTGIVIELATALTDWARLRRWINNDTDDKSWQHLLAVADAIDPDPWRRNLRAAWKTKDGEANQVRDLAGSADVRSLPPSSIRMLGDLVADRVSKDDAADLMWKAQQQHPGDFWINLRLAYFLSDSRPKRLDEAVIFYHVALGIRPGHAQVLNNLGLVRMDQGMSDEAIAFYKRAVKLAPKHAIPHYNLGVQLGRIGKRDEALVRYRMAIELDPKFVMAHYNLGNDLKAQGKPDEAIECYRTAIELDPKFANAHTNLGAVLYEQGKPDEAIECYHTAIELDPKHAPAHNNLGLALFDQGKPDEAIECYHTVIELDPKYAGAHNNLGVVLSEKGKRDEAIECYRTAIELDPKDANAHNSLGADLYEQDKLDEAIECYHTAIELDPKHAMAHNNLGVALFDQGKPDEAIECYRTAIELDPKHAMAHNNLAQALRIQGKPVEAIECYRTAIELDPNNASAHNSLGVVLSEQGELDAAIECYRTAIEVDPKHAMPHNNLGNALKNKGELDQAIAEYRTAIELDPKCALAHNNLGIAQHEQGKLDEAIACYRTAIELDPNKSMFYTNLVWLLATAGDPAFRNPSEAVTLARKATEVQPKDANHWCNRGVAEYRAGNWQDSVDAFRQADVLIGGSGDRQHRFFLAMAHWQLGNQAEADEAYVQAITWLNKRKINGGEQIRFRDEAEQLMGIAAAERSAIVLASLTRAIEADPDNAKLYRTRGKILTETKQWQLAVDNYSELIRLEPKNVDRYWKRTDAYLKLRNWEGVIEDCTTMIKLDPQLKHYNRRSSIHLSKNDLDLAIADCAESIRVNPDDISAHSIRFWARFGKQQFSRALEDNEAIKPLGKKSNWYQGYLRPAYIYWARGDYDQALIETDRAIENRPELPLAYRMKGWSLMQLGRLDDALEPMNRAVTIDENSDSQEELFWSYFVRGCLYVERGDRESAQADFDNALIAFNESIDRDPALDIWETLMITIVHGQLGNQQKAAEYYAQALELIERWPIDQNHDLLWFHDKAKSLLETSSTAEETSEKDK